MQRRALLLFLILLVFRSVLVPAHADVAPAHADAPPAHADAPPAHADAPPAHADAPPAHADAPPAHAPAPLAHADAPAHSDAPPGHADAPPVLGDRTFGGIGVDVTLDRGRLIVSKPLDGLPAARDGIRAGDEIVSIDGHPVDTTSLDAACRGLTGPVGTKVVVGVRHKGAHIVELLTVERAAMVASAVTFNDIPPQVVEGLFQISLHVVDSSGRPLPNADIEIKLDPAYTSAHFLFISTRIYLKNAAGYVVPALTARTDANGDALIWVRLDSATTPFRAKLSATVTYENTRQGPIPSNVFSVDRRNNE